MSQRRTTSKVDNLSIDFLSAQLCYRRKSLLHSRELIAKAVGHKEGTGLKILDATAGFGVDAFILACLGHDVTMLERSTVVAALLQDGLDRALLSDDYKFLRLKLINVDAIFYIRQLAEQEKPDVIYLDPMYPVRSKSALNKKSLRILRDIVGEDDDASFLLEAALDCAKKRVVVKRPRLAPRLGSGEVISLQPTFILSGKSCRYDVYQMTAKQ